MLSLNLASRGHVLFAMNKITVIPSGEFHLTATPQPFTLKLSLSHRNTHTLYKMWITVANNSPWVVGQTIIVGVSMLIMCD